MKTLEQLEKENEALREALKECQIALNELLCYDEDFYDRTCPGLLARLDVVIHGSD